MRFDRESWRKLYRYEPLDQRAWPVVTRAIRDHLIRYPDELDGILLSVRGHEGDIATKVVEALADALGARTHERELVVAALGTLLVDGYISVQAVDGDTSGTWRVVIRNFERAQKSHEALKKAAQRARAKGVATGTDGGQTEDNEGDTVGDTSGTSRARTPARVPGRDRAHAPVDEIRRDETRPDDTRRAGAREDEPDGGGPFGSDPGRETVCPLDLVERAERVGVLAELAEKLPAPIDAVRAEAREFVAYWTVGGGHGRRRTVWMNKLRQRIVVRHGEGLLGASRNGTLAPDSDAPDPERDKRVAAARERAKERERKLAEAARTELLAEPMDGDVAAAQAAAAGKPGGMWRA